MSYFFSCSKRSKSEADPVFEAGAELGNVDPFLLHGVAVADGDRVVVEGIEVESDAEGGTDLVLTAVAFADAPRLRALRRTFRRVSLGLRIAAMFSSTLRILMQLTGP